MATALAPEEIPAPNPAGDAPPIRVEATDAVVAAVANLVRTAKAVARSRQDRIGATGTPLAVLRALSRAGGDDRPGDLALATGVAPSVVSRVLARLEEDGLVARHRDEEDARACHITLTDQGRGKLEAIQDDYRTVLGAALAELDDDDIDRIPSLLHRLEQAIVRAAERRAARGVLRAGQPLDHPYDQPLRHQATTEGH
jgi:DNA-binding MarR family transcriptional regulator